MFHVDFIILLFFISIAYTYLAQTKKKNMSNPDDFNQRPKNPWNQIFMPYDIDEQMKTDDYKISSSLETIWNDVSDERSNSSHSQTDENSMETCSQNSVTAIADNSFQSHYTSKVFGPVDNANNINSNSKGRAITARNCGQTRNGCNENQVS